MISKQLDPALPEIFNPSPPLTPLNFFYFFLLVSQLRNFFFLSDIVFVFDLPIRYVLGYISFCIVLCVVIFGHICCFLLDTLPILPTFSPSVVYEYGLWYKVSNFWLHLVFFSLVYI